MLGDDRIEVLGTAGLVGEAPDALGVDGAGGDGVDADALVGELDGEVLGEAGWFCANDDPAVWRAGLNALGADESERRRLATSARERTAVFDLTRMVRRYAELLSDRR